VYIVLSIHGWRTWRQIMAARAQVELGEAAAAPASSSPLTETGAA